MSTTPADQATIDPKPFKVWIRWGETSTQEETYATPRNANLYEFATSGELDAFLSGVDEALGWMDADSFLTEEELHQEPATWLEKTGYTRDDGTRDDDLTCAECGRPYFVDDAGCTHHIVGDTGFTIDHDTDEDHTAYGEEEPD